MASSDAQVDNPLRRIAFWCALGYVFIRFSMIHEIIAGTLGLHTYLLYLVAPPALIGVALTGGVGRTFRGPSRVAFYWTGFLAWMILSVPFSSWRGGSFAFLVSYLKSEIIAVFLVAGLAMTWKEILAVVNTIAAAGLFNIVAGKLFATEAVGRLGVEIGSIGNPNDFAAHLLAVMPFLLSYALLRKRSAALKLAVSLLLAYGLYLILLTGSRGALVALAVTLGFTLIRATVTKRLSALALATFLAAMVFFVLSDDIRTRLLSFSTDVREAEDVGAAESALSRRYLMEQAVIFTLKNPLFGVGPRQFATYEGQTRKAEGSHGSWHEVHNSYLQVAAEMGLPALFFYLAGVFGTDRLLRKIQQRARQIGPAVKDIETVAFCARLSLIAFGTAIFFLTFYGKFYLPFLSGFSIALYFAAEREFARFQTDPAGPPAAGPQWKLFRHLPSR